MLQPGCATTQFVELRSRPRNPLAERLQTSTLGQLRPSARAESFLRQTGYRGPEALSHMLPHAARQTSGSQRHEALYTLAELNYLGAQAVSSKDPPLASELYLDSAHSAWDYFCTPLPGGTLPDPADSRHRDTAEAYNTSCEALLRMAVKHDGCQLGDSLQLKLSGRQIDFEIPFPSRLINSDSLERFEFVSDFRLTNLRNRHTTDGLGVPIIAVRRPAPVPQPIEQYYTRGMSCAATLLLRFPERLSADPAADHQVRGLPVRLQAFDPRESDGFMVQQTELPLESDLSTPLARFLSNPDLRLLDTWAFIRPDRAKAVSGLYMVQPYDPDRIPVLMVHGIWSSPMTWMEMFNDLQADPEIRRRYQFWFYLYPTGEPLAFAAADLRDELRRVREDCDPDHSNRRLDQMVIVGHSMGGLISHLLTIDSDDRLWNAVSRVNLEQLRAQPEQKQEIRRVFFFESHPAVSRIVTIASPYNGSRYSNALTRWLGSSLVWLPSRTMQLSRLVLEHNNPGIMERILPQSTSLDSLADKSAVLTLIRETQVPPEVPHHNIVAVRRGRSERDWTDGVVRYLSAHREDADSEVVVPASHNEVHRHPQTIDEVRRVLIVHLNESQRRRIRAIPVRQSTDLSGTASQPTDAHTPGLLPARGALIPQRTAVPGQQAP